jgi:hypothetical protein
MFLVYDAACVYVLSGFNNFIFGDGFAINRLVWITTLGNPG